MRKNIICCIITVGIVIISGCGSTPVIQDGTYVKSSDKKTEAVLKKIAAINSNAPRSFRASFNVYGRIGKQRKFKSIGRCVYSKKLKKLRMNFVDSVFRTSLAVVFQNDTAVKIYLPVEKKVYIDDVNKISLKNYTGINIDYRFISTLATGMIPLIENFRVKKGLMFRKENNRSGSDIFVILENDSMFQTISIKNDIPNKILLVNKKTLEKMEFYLENPVTYGANKSLYYKSIRFHSKKKGERINLSFSRIRHNAKINDRRDFRIRIPRSARTVRVN